MEKIDRYRQIVEKLVRDHARPYANPDIEVYPVIDREGDHYQVLNAGWSKKRPAFGPTLHIDIRDGKIWIQHDFIEGGVAEELVEAGVPREDIVLAFHPPRYRKYTDFAES